MGAGQFCLTSGKFYPASYSMWRFCSVIALHVIMTDSNKDQSSR